MSDVRMPRSSGKAPRTVPDEPWSINSDYVIREMVVADAPWVQQLLQTVPEASNWSFDIIRNSLHSNGGIAFVCETNQVIVGCIFGASVACEAEILNLAVLPQNRQKGIASRLVRHLLARWLQQKVQRIFLEVRESNAPAIRFYHKMGFEELGRRKKYYSHPDEDALILELSGNVK